MEKHLSSGALLSDDALKVSVERPARTSLMEAMGTVREKGSEGMCVCVRERGWRGKGGLREGRAEGTGGGGGLWEAQKYLMKRRGYSCHCMQQHAPVKE